MWHHHDTGVSRLSHALISRPRSGSLEGHSRYGSSVAATVAERYLPLAPQHQEGRSRDMDSLLFFLAELLIQALCEVGPIFSDLTSKDAPGIVRNTLKAIFYAIFGIALAAFSLWIIPSPFIATTPNPWMSLLLVPLSASIYTVCLARWLESKRHRQSDLRWFSFSLILAFAFAATRYLYMTR